jgi:hypothetical protein
MGKTKETEEFPLPNLNFSEPDKFEWEEEKIDDKVEEKEEPSKEKEEEEPKEEKTVEGGGARDKKKAPKEEVKIDEEEEGEPEENEHEDVVSSFYDVIADKMGFNFGEDFEKPKTIEDLTLFFDAYLEENSKPRYSSEITQRLDAYLANGGNFESFYKIQKDAIEYDNIDIEDESSQKRVITDYLEANGYNYDQIAKKVKKYEETGILKDEAEDALDRVKKIKEREAVRLEAEQTRAKKEEDDKQKAMFENIAGSIKTLDNIRGIKVGDDDKRALVNFMFKVQPNGRTKWQEEYGKNVKNVIESAFFTMKGDSLIESAKKSGETSAVSKFKKALASNKVKGTKTAAKTGDVDDFISAWGI